MRSPAHDIAVYLAAQGVGTLGGSTAWSINISREPNKPDRSVTIYDTGGAEAFPDIDLFTPSVQIRVRAEATAYPTAFDKHEEIRDILIQAQNVTLGAANDTRYLGFWLEGDIQSIGRDENDRHILTANYRIERQPIT